MYNKENAQKTLQIDIFLPNHLYISKKNTTFAQILECMNFCNYDEYENN